MSRTMAVICAAAVFAVGVAACGGASDGQPSATFAEGEAGYPVKIVNCGRPLEFTKTPQRVVVMNGNSVAEISTLVELGAASHVIANAQGYGSSEVKGRADVIQALPTGGFTPNALQDIGRDDMLALKPDLVISHSDAGFDPALGFATREELTEIGALTYIPPHKCEVPEDPADLPAETIEDSYAMMRDLGMLFGVSEKAEQLIATSKAQIAAVEAKVKGRTARPVLVALPGMGKGSTGDFSYVGVNGIWNDILAKAGGLNAFAAPTGPPTTVPERGRLSRARVDAVVFVAYRNRNPAKVINGIFLAYPRWDASRRGRSLVLSDSLYLGPSNHLAVEQIARLLHPQAFADR